MKDRTTRNTKHNMEAQDAFRLGGSALALGSSASGRTEALASDTWPREALTAAGESVGTSGNLAAWPWEAVPSSGGTTQDSGPGAQRTADSVEIGTTPEGATQTSETLAAWPWEALPPSGGSAQISASDPRETRPIARGSHAPWFAESTETKAGTAGSSTGVKATTRGGETARALAAWAERAANTGTSATTPRETGSAPQTSGPLVAVPQEKDTTAEGTTRSSLERTGLVPRLQAALPEKTESVPVTTARASVAAPVETSAPWADKMAKTGASAAWPRETGSLPGTPAAMPEETETGPAETVQLYQVKAVLMGDVGAGKTSLLNALRSVYLTPAIQKMGIQFFPLKIIVCP